MKHIGTSSLDFYRIKPRFRKVNYKKTDFVLGPGHAAAADLLGVQHLLEASDREVQSIVS